MLETHAQYIHCHVLHHGSGASFDATFIYASNDAVCREDLWSSLVRLSGSVQRWVVLGDFNVVRDVQERINESAPALADILAFNACLLRCGLEDLKANFLPSGISDHSPCLVSIFEDVRRPPRFQFLHCWVDHPDYKNVVQSAWSIPTSGTVMFRFFAKLRNVKTTLIRLHKSNFSSILQRIAQAKHDLDACQVSLQHSPSDAFLQQQEQHLQARYVQLRGVEMSILRQRDKFSTIVYNDSNTSVFHARIRERRHSQIIGEIVDHNGNVQTGLDKVADSFVAYYTSILGSSSHVEGLDHTFIAQDGRLEPDTWPGLTAPVTELEILTALRSIDIMKSPGPDGFSSAFFIQSWSIVGRDLCDCVTDFFCYWAFGKTGQFHVGYIGS
ncbi:hypothetical protein RND81_11G039500 [Saponaria officinalis]|uniref:Uncharacterized protein n=1 Tax=Saponaria officinalis TaxID=3572 RepID=A0AAW1HGM6_SAPOF